MVRNFYAAHLMTVMWMIKFYQKQMPNYIQKQHIVRDNVVN